MSSCSENDASNCKSELKKGCLSCSLPWYVACFPSCCSADGCVTFPAMIVAEGTVGITSHCPQFSPTSAHCEIVAMFSCMVVPCTLLKFMRRAPIRRFRRRRVPSRHICIQPTMVRRYVCAQMILADTCTYRPCTPVINCMRNKSCLCDMVV